MKKYIYALMLPLLLSGIAVAESTPHSYMPEQGYVPDAQTALKIAEAVWLPIYGDSIYTKKTFTATQEGEKWVVQGSLPKQTVGGVPVAEISKKSGEILRVSHGK